MTSMRRQNDRILKEELLRSVGAQYATGDQWRNNPARMKGWSQSKNSTQLWMGLVIEARPNAQQKSLKCSIWMQSQKWQNDLCSFPRQTIQYYGNPSLCPNQLCWISWSWMGLWRPTRSFRTPKKDVLFIIGGWNAKVGSQETPGVIGKCGLGVRNEAGQRLIEFCQENALS